MYMDNIKLFGKMKKNWRLKLPRRIYSQDIGLEFGIKMCLANNEISIYE